jgi:hypothetical protein
LQQEIKRKNRRTIIMPMGKGTYGSKKGRPPKKNGAKKLMAKNPKMPKAVAKAIAKNMKKKKK